MNTASEKSGLFISIAIILAVVVGGVFYATVDKSARHDLTVTGSARESVVSDQVIWRLSVQRSVPRKDLAAGYTQIASDIGKVQNFLVAQGIKAEDISVNPINAYSDWSENNGGAIPFADRRMNLSQSLAIRSSEVDKVTELTKNIQNLVEGGIFFDMNTVEYYYTGLSEARVKLLTDATKDARERAEAMVAGNGGHAGDLVSASSGVVQVLSKGSVEVSDYGSYDTTTKEKEIMVTVRATFKIK
jgi:hypothetical protein